MDDTADKGIGGRPRTERKPDPEWPEALRRIYRSTPETQDEKRQARAWRDIVADLIVGRK